MFFGYLGDKLNKKYMLLAAAIIAILFSQMVFKGFINGDISLLGFAFFCTFSYGIAVALVPSVLAESFPTEVRYTGVGLVYNLSFATTGGLAPVIIFDLIHMTNNMLMPAIYFMAVAAIALVGIVFYPKDNFSGSNRH